MTTREDKKSSNNFAVLISGAAAGTATYAAYLYNKNNPRGRPNHETPPLNSYDRPRHI